MSYRDRFETSKAVKATLAKQQLIDAVILIGEADRLLGHSYPKGDPRGVDIKMDVGERVEQLRDIYTADMESDRPRLYKWNSQRSRAIEDALVIQDNISDATDGKQSVTDFIEHLTYLNYPIHVQGKSASR